MSEITPMPFRATLVAEASHASGLQTALLDALQVIARYGVFSPLLSTYLGMLSSTLTYHNGDKGRAVMVRVDIVVPRSEIERQEREQLAALLRKYPDELSEAIRQNELLRQ